MSLIRPYAYAYNEACKCIRPDHIIMGLGFLEGSGGTLVNIGRYSPPFNVSGSGASAWVTDADGHAYLSDTLGNERVTVLANGSGADYIFPCGTVHGFYDVSTASAATRQLFVSTNAPTNAYCLSGIRLSSAGLLRARLNNNTTQLSSTAAYPNGPFGLTTRFGDAGGFRAHLNGSLMAEEATFTGGSAYTGPAKILNGQSFLVGASSTAFGAVDKYALWIWDVVLTDEELLPLVADPYLPMRNQPTTLFETWVGSPPYRVTTTTVLFRMLTATGLSGTAAYRAKVATSAFGLLTATPSAGVSTTSALAVLDLTYTGLTAGTHYYYELEFQHTDSKWYPFPGGIGEFWTVGS